MSKFKIIPAGFRQRIILGFSCLVLLFLGIMIIIETVGISGTVIQGSLSRYRSKALKDMEIVSILLSQHISSWINERRINVEALSRSPIFRQAIVAEKPGSNNEFAYELNTFIESHKEFEALAIIHTEDASVCAASGYFANARSISDIFIDSKILSLLTIPGYLETIDIRTPTDKKSRLRIIRQIISPDKPNKIIAILVAEINIDSTLRPIILSMSNVLSENWECILANNAKDIITKLGSRSHDYSDQRNTISDLDAFPPIRLAIGGLEGPYDGPDENGSPVLAFYRQIKINQGIAWALILKMDRSVALNPSWTVIFTQIILWLLMFVVGISACFIIARQVTNPLYDLVVVAQRIESGDLSARASESTRSEIGLLAKVFNNMIGRLQNMQQDLENQVLDRTRELMESEERYRMIFNNAPLGVMHFDANGIIVDFNDNFAQIMGAPREKILGFKMLERLSDKAMLKAVKDALGGQYGYYEGEYISVTGQRKTFLRGIYQAITDDSGVIIGAVGIFEDITERKRLEQELKEYQDHLESLVQKRTAELARSNADLEQFAYVASHDLQEPLRMVASFTQLLAKRYMGKLDADADEFISFAVDGANRMQRLINDLLAYSRVTTRRSPFGQVDCEKVLDSVTKSLSLAIDESGATIIRDPLPVITGDHTQLGRVFQNLITNAIKFRSDEPLKIHISAILKENDWVFSARDNGIGIDSNHFERIFVIFQRLIDKKETSGTGIGLAICKKIVENHGGRIWVESRHGEGSAFYFTIPQRQVK